MARGQSKNQINPLFGTRLKNNLGKQQQEALVKQIQIQDFLSVLAKQEQSSRSFDLYKKGQLSIDFQEDDNGNEMICVKVDAMFKQTSFYNAQGLVHRIDKPAITQTDFEAWYLDGELHREDGPAVVDQVGSQSWFLKGQRHREGGPARTSMYGEQYWYQNNKLHCQDGPSYLYVPNLPNFDLRKYKEAAQEIFKWEKSQGSKTPHDHEDLQLPLRMWHLDGIRYLEQDYRKELKARNLSF